MNGTGNVMNMSTKKGNVGPHRGNTVASLGHVAVKLGGRRATLGYTSQGNWGRHQILIKRS